MSNQWPTTFPGPLMGSYTFSRTPAYVEDTSEVGKSRRRLRYSKAFKQIKFSVKLTEAQVLELDTFYKDTCTWGVDSFVYHDYLTDEDITVTFDEYPDIQHNEGSASDFIVYVALTES